MGLSWLSIELFALIFIEQVEVSCVALLALEQVVYVLDL
jgi:hypothetical protein